MKAAFLALVGLFVSHSALAVHCDLQLSKVDCCVKDAIAKWDSLENRITCTDGNGGMDGITRCLENPKTNKKECCALGEQAIWNPVESKLICEL